MTTQLGTIDMFVERPALVKARACAVCNLRADVLICRECAVDPAASCARVRAWLDGVLAQIDTHVQAFHALQDAHPAHWAKLEEARGGADFAAKAAAHRADGNVYGRLLEAEEHLHRALEPLGLERARLERALGLLEALSGPVVLAAGEYVLPTGVDVEACRSCGASIVWSKTAAGKAVPLSLALVEERGGQRVTKTHFIDCPDGRGWKR